MNKYIPYLSPTVVEDILLFCGNSSPTPKQYWVLSELLMYALENPRIKQMDALTDRERACLFWMAHGNTVNETAALMGVKKSTIVTFRQRIKSKLKCKTLAQAIFLTICYQPIGDSIAKLIKSKMNKD